MFTSNTPSPSKKNALLPQKIVLLGAGRVAHWLAVRFFEKKLPLVQIFNRSEASVKSLAQQVEAMWTNNFEEIVTDADLYLLAVRDDAIELVAEKLAQLQPSGLVCHVSGAMSGSVLQTKFARSGVFWMPQTFSKNERPRWSATPVCLDANTASDIRMLEKLARTMGIRPHRVKENQRAQLHLAAVFANNFTNHCLAISEKLVEEVGLNFEILHPIIESTFVGATKNSPKNMQTGPAKRRDVSTQNKHLQLIEAHPNWQKLYRILSIDIEQSNDLL